MLKRIQHSLSMQKKEDLEDMYFPMQEELDNPDKPLEDIHEQITLLNAF